MDVKSDDASGASMESEGLLGAPPLLVVKLLGTLLNCYWGRRQ